ncbi:MAG TPA: hypothetical protein VL225_09170 [Vicinamibacterales bacterium]|nr:hypothetical protein [Vicinamibacterales bacterium]
MRFTDSITIDASAGTSQASLFVEATADYLKDHFPGAPTLPGLVMLESAVRAAAALWEAAAPEHEGAAALEHVERLQIVRPVVPGETLIVDATIEAGDGRPGTRWFMARATVGGETAMRARFRLIRGETR